MHDHHEKAVSDCNGWLLAAGDNSSADNLTYHLQVCCLVGDQIQDVLEGLSKLVWPSDCHPLLFFNVDTNGTARGNLDSMKSDFRALGAVVKCMGAQVVLSSILPVSRKDVRRRVLIMQASNWLWSWCWWQGFGFYNHWSLFLQTSTCLREMGSTLLSRAKVSLPVGCVSW